MLDLEGIKTQLMKGKTIEDILEKYDWKNFEKIIAEIFRENGFYTKQNFRFKTKRAYEIDIIAVRNNQVFCIDCKWWGRGRYKKTGLRHAITSQENRVRKFTKFLKKNPIAKGLLKLNSKYKVYPLLVTLHDEDLIKENDTFVVPAWKLNRFTTEIENYI